MNRFPTAPRKNWEQIVESQGLLYHTTDDGQYWNESAYYSFWMHEADRIEAATATLHAMCLQAGQRIIDENLFQRMNIGPESEALIRQTWETEPPALYGRFDLAYDGTELKLLEYNADTPTALLEAAVIQWYWLQDKFAAKDQFNSLHEKLVAKWKDIRSWLGEVLVHFASLVNREDAMTITYLAETASQAGLETNKLRVADIGLDRESGHFVDMEDRRIKTLFKLYPWENLMQDEFGAHIESSGTYFIEPAWKMMWSNKAILAILWEMFPNHELLLPAYLERPSSIGSYVRKPLIGREGANVTVFGPSGNELIFTDGPYGAPWVYQQMAKVPSFDDMRPIIGSWVIDGEPAGMGIREDRLMVTGNASQFVPHVIE